MGGVEKGWRMLQMEGAQFSEKALDALIGGTREFCITFAAPGGLNVKPQEMVRFGTDLGGVLNKHNNDIAGDVSRWHLQVESEAPGAIGALTEIASRIGPKNVYIVSKVGGAMQNLSEIWLHETMDICGRTGIPKANIHFCRDIEGPNGKGPIASDLRLTHFVDDKDEALRAVYEDRAGNARATIDQHNGQLFHFGRSGVGQTPPSPDKWRANVRPSCVVPVANWQQLLMKLNLPQER